LERESKTSKVLYTIKSIVSWVILAVVVFLIATIFISRINGKTPTVMGYSFFRVSSESMLPTLEVGDIILVKECEITDLKVEDIVTYNGTKGNMAGKIITHRVVEAPYEKNGKTFVITCGDANDLNDPKVGAEQIIGKMERKLPLFSKLFNLFLTPLGLLIIILLIVLAFLPDILNFAKAVSNNTETGREKSIEDIVARIQQEEKIEDNKHNSEE